MFELTTPTTAHLGSVYASLRDGMSTAAEWFDPIEPAPGSAPSGSAADKVKDAIRKRGVRHIGAGVTVEAVNSEDETDSTTAA